MSKMFDNHDEYLRGVIEKGLEEYATSHRASPGPLGWFDLADAGIRDVLAEHIAKTLKREYPTGIDSR